MKVCFIGHKIIEKTESLIALLKETIIRLINKGATTFLFGSKSEFDSLAWEVVTQLKGEYSFIKRVYVRANYKDITQNYNDYLLKFYEETFFPTKVNKAGKNSYIKRNYEMIDNSNFCVFYYNKNYVPLNPQRSSGTKIAYKYAVKSKKEIINLY